MPDLSTSLGPSEEPTAANEEGGTGPSIDLPDWIRTVVGIDRDADALQFEGRWYSWGWLADGVTSLRSVLDELGHGDSVRVGVVMRNRPEILRTVAAVLGARCCLVTLSSAVPMAKLAAEVEQMRLPVVLASEQDWRHDELVAAVRAAGSAGIATRTGDSAYDTVVAPEGDPRHGSADTSPGVAVEMLTSGTTGPPKRIDLRYRALEHEIESTAQYRKAGALTEPRLSSGTALLWTPLLHIGGLRGAITSLVEGRKMALLERFSVDSWVAMVREHRPRAVSLVPAALAMVLEANVPSETFDGVAALFCGTAPLDPDLGRRFEDRYGVPVLVVYGATEFAGGVAGWTLADWKRFGPDKVGSVGRPNAGVKVRVVDQDAATEVSRGEVGLLEVQARQLGTDAWVRTTDLARIDEDDFIWIVGRADDVIVRGGFKVATNAVRDVICEHPSVRDAGVVGIPDARLGQVPVAAVELREGAAPIGAEDVMAWARERLAAYQVPVQVRILDHLPRTPSMKVSQVALRSLFGDVDRSR